MEPIESCLKKMVERSLEQEQEQDIPVIREPPDLTFDFQREHIIQDRQSMFLQLCESHPAHIPIILRTEKDAAELSKTRFVCPEDMTIGAFQLQCRKHLSEVVPCESLFFFTQSNTVPIQTSSLADVWQRHRSQEDSFLYLTLMHENTFGK